MSGISVKDRPDTHVCGNPACKRVFRRKTIAENERVFCCIACHGVARYGDRNAIYERIVQWKHAGFSYREIGRFIGISGQRVAMIYRRATVKGFKYPV